MTKDYIDRLALIKIHDNKVLVARNKGKDAWYIPGGKREKGESDAEAFERTDPAKPGTIIKITFYTGSYFGESAPHSEVEEIDYFSYQQKPPGSVIFDSLKEKGLIN